MPRGRRSQKVDYSDDGDMFCRWLAVGVIGVLGNPEEKVKLLSFRKDVYVLRINSNRTAYCKDHKVLQAIQILRDFEVNEPLNKIAWLKHKWNG